MSKKLEDTIVGKNHIVINEHYPPFSAAPFHLISSSRDGKPAVEVIWFRLPNVSMKANLNAYLAFDCINNFSLWNSARAM
jgi:hypothetical protein